MKDPTLQNTVLCIVHNRPVQDATRNAINALCDLGAVVFSEKGHTDVTYGRALALTKLLDSVHDAGRLTESTVVLCVDDDMVFRASDAKAVVESVIETRRPASGCYATQSGFMAASRLCGIEWEVGLGFCAFGLWDLERLAAKHPKRLACTWYWGVVPFCQSGAHPEYPERWSSEDFWLSRELGGVDLLPIPIGHFKTVPLYPDAETLRRIKDGEMGELTPPKVQRYRGTDEPSHPLAVPADQAPGIPTKPGESPAE